MKSTNNHLATCFLSFLALMLTAFGAAAQASMQAWPSATPQADLWLPGEAMPLNAAQCPNSSLCGGDSLSSLNTQIMLSAFDDRAQTAEQPDPAKDQLVIHTGLSPVKSASADTPEPKLLSFISLGFIGFGSMLRQFRTHKYQTFNAATAVNRSPIAANGVNAIKNRD